VPCEVERTDPVAVLELLRAELIASPNRSISTAAAVVGSVGVTVDRSWPSRP
jgi:hypothetical protein